jgi:uncharacterized protein YbaR (Trm112 family)
LKGKIICPECNNEFILELTENKKIHVVICPKCKNKFSVKAKCDSKELSWEEYGEPRKTVLSCIKPRSNKPLIAVILLVCIFSIGISTAIFSDIFIISTSYANSFLNFKDIINMNISFSIIIVIFSVFALLAIFACIKRKHFSLAVIGSFIAIFSFGFFFISSILGIIAFVLIFISRDEFEDGKKAKIF